MSKKKVKKEEMLEYNDKHPITGLPYKHDIVKVGTLSFKENSKTTSMKDLYGYNAKGNFSILRF